MSALHEKALATARAFPDSSIGQKRAKALATAIGKLTPDLMKLDANDPDLFTK